MYRVTLLFVALGLIYPVCCAESTADSSAVLNAATYAFYSSMYRNSNSLMPGEIVDIAAEPMAFPSKSRCLKPSTEEERRMVETANQLSTKRLTWKRQFDFGHPYLLIPPTETTKAIDCIGQYHGQSPMTGCEPYAKLRFVRFLSVPVFNADGTRALIAISRACGGLCGNGSVQVYRRTHDGWKLEPTSFAKCSWVS